MPDHAMRSRPHVILGVAGGIAAYKACELLRLFTESGHEVTVVPTRDALRFVGEPTWAALSGRPVHTDVWQDVHEVPHVRLGQTADLVVVAPATADLLARAAHGLADDLLTNTLLTARCPVVFAPAMHTEMWEHGATRANVALLRVRGAVVIEPAEGRLTGVDSGKGRLPDPDEIFSLALDVMKNGATDSAGISRGSTSPRPTTMGPTSMSPTSTSPTTGSATGPTTGAAFAPTETTPEREQDLAGRQVVVSAGGTREYLDPVRFIGNRSSGRQGYALAEAAVARGAEVTLVAANTELPDPAGVKVVRVETTEQMLEQVLTACVPADALVMAAAPADFRPTWTQQTKIKKPLDGSAPVIELTQNPDILAEVARHRPNSRIVVVGFAAETGDETASVLELGRAKLARKGCDLLVINDVSGGAVFGSDENEAVVLGTDGATTSVPRGSKAALSHVVWDRVVALW